MRIGKTRTPRQLLMVLTLFLAGCGGVALDDLTNLFGKQKKFYDAAKDFQARGRYYDAAVNAMEALRIKSDYADAKILLRDVAPRAYQERLVAVEGTARTSPEAAVGEYQALKQFTDEIGRFGVPLQVIDYGAKLQELDSRIKQLKSAEAGKAYAEAGELFQRGQYEDAVASYRKVLQLVPDHGAAKERIAECLYLLASADLNRQHYRKAAERFREADAQVAGFRDARPRAAKIYIALAKHFLAQGYARNAIQDFQEADRLLPNLPDVASGLQAARNRAVRRIAVVGVSNRTGQNIQGISVEDFIGDEIFDQLQRKKSQFIEVYARTQLDTILGEQQLGLEAIIDKATAPEIGRLKGVSYLIVGKITQVSQKLVEPTSRRRETSYRVGVYQTVTQYDRKGRPYTVQKHVGDRNESVRYDEIQWTTEVVFAGSVAVFEVETGKVVVTRSFDKRESAGGRWAENLSDPQAQKQLAPEVQQLFAASKRVVSADAMAKTAIKGLVEELVSSLLSAIDRTPGVPDPVGMLAGLS